MQVETFQWVFFLTLVEPLSNSDIPGTFFFSLIHISKPLWAVTKISLLVAIILQTVVPETLTAMETPNKTEN